MSVGYFSGRVFWQSWTNVYQSIPLFIFNTYIVFTLLTIHESSIYLKCIYLYIKDVLNLSFLTNNMCQQNPHGCLYKGQEKHFIYSFSSDINNINLNIDLIFAKFLHAWNYKILMQTKTILYLFEYFQIESTIYLR